MKGEETKQGQGEQGYSGDPGFSHWRHGGRIAQEGRLTLEKMASVDFVSPVRDVSRLDSILSGRWDGDAKEG